MKYPNLKHWFRAGLAGLMLTGALGTSQAQTFITTTYTNAFDTGGNTSDFTGGSVGSWLYWYGVGGGNTAMTNSVSHDALNSSTSGSLEVVSPFPAGGDQNVFFGTFGNGYGYDFSTRANLLLYTNITFDIRTDPSMTPRQSNGTNVDFGTIGVGMINAGYGYTEFGRATIPLSSTNSWAHISVNIDYTKSQLNNAPGIAFNINSYGGYPRSLTMKNWIDNLKLNLTPGPPPPAPTLSKLAKATPGFNAIATGSGQYDREQLATVASSGYTFAGQSSVTYSFNIASFPTGTAGSFQQHLFIVNGAPGQYDQAADYNLAQCVFMTIQQSDAGVATFNFRYKTNQPGGNAMLFNGTDPTNTASNPNGWPIMPIASLQAPGGAVGTWSVTFANSTNITVHAPDGSSTNFTWDAASAALFSDPATLLLGGQPNNANGYGKGVVYNSFSAAGCASPFSDNFLADQSLNTNVWKNLSNDKNGAVLVPSTSAYWLGISLPDDGYSLQSKASLTPGIWNSLSGVPISRIQGKDYALLDNTNLPSASSGYFRMFQPTFTKLQILLPGETAAPNTVTGKTGTPTEYNAGDVISVIVNAVDANWNLINSATDVITLTSTDVNDFLPNNAALVNGTVQFYVQTGSSGTNTITASDVTDPTKTANTSSPLITH